MKTASIYISTLCVPCANRCRYCLLSWDGRLTGLDYDRSQQYARGFYDWLQIHRPDLGFQFYFGYSMDHPLISEAIAFARKTGSAGAEFLQLDGLRFRDEPELGQWLQMLRQNGIRAIDLTFYGTRDYHDRFAGRAGDFYYMLRILDHGLALGLEVFVSIPIFLDNCAQMEGLLDLFQGKATRIRVFIPHREGRGAHLESTRLTKSSLDALSPRVKSHLNLKRYRSEGQWVREGRFDQPQQRMLGLVLTPDNIARLEGTSYEAVLSGLEAMDDEFYEKIPPLEDLADSYGDPAGEKLFDQRDLYLYYQSKYIREHGLQFYDVNDERHCFSRRF